MILGVKEAAKTGNLDQLKQLVTDANVNDLSFTNMSALEYAAGHGHCHCIIWLIDQRKANLRYAVFHAFTDDSFKCLLQRGANPNQKLNGVPLLNMFINFADRVQLLLDYGADPTAIDNNNGYPALALALDNYFPTVVNMSACRIMDSGIRLHSVRKILQVPTWAIEYEFKLDQKRLRCSKSSVALWVVLLKSRVPKDLIRQIIRDKIKPKWIIF